MKPHTLLLLSILLLASGCETDGPYPAHERSPSVESENTAVILDEDLVSQVAVDERKSDRTSQGRLKVRASVRNRTANDIVIQVQTVFRDADGTPLQDDSAWDTITLSANESKTVGATSTSKKAESYTVRVRKFR